MWSVEFIDPDSQIHGASPDVSCACGVQVICSVSSVQGKEKKANNKISGEVHRKIN